MFYVAWYNKHLQAQLKAYFPNAQGNYIQRPKIMQHMSCSDNIFPYSYSSTGPGAYAPDALQPIGLLCNPEPPPMV